MDNSWIKLYRKLTDWEWFCDANMVQLYLYLLLSANVEDKRWMGIVIKRGQFATSLSKISERLKMSRQTLRTCLSRLQRTGEINQQNNQRFTIITICKYDSYQDTGKSANQLPTNCQPQTNQQANHKLTINQPQTNQQIECSKFCKSSNYNDDNSEANHKLTTNQPQINQQANHKLTTTKEYKNIKNASTSVLAKENKFSCKPDVSLGEEFKNYYNGKLDENNGAMPRIKSKIENRRLAMLKARVKEYGEDEVKQVIDLASQSQFLNGGGSKGFVASFEWIMRPNNFPKILDGNYNDKDNYDNKKAVSSLGDEAIVKGGNRDEAAKAQRKSEAMGLIMALRAKDEAKRKAKAVT